MHFFCDREEIVLLRETLTGIIMLEQGVSQGDIMKISLDNLNITKWGGWGR